MVERNYAFCWIQKILNPRKNICVRWITIFNLRWLESRIYTDCVYCCQCLKFEKNILVPYCWVYFCNLLFPMWIYNPNFLIIVIALESKKRYPLIPNQKLCDILFQNVNFICFDLVEAHKDSRIIKLVQKSFNWENC